MILLPGHQVLFLPQERPAVREQLNSPILVKQVSLDLIQPFPNHCVVEDRGHEFEALDLECKVLPSVE